MSNAIESLARDEADSAAARAAIWLALGVAGGYRPAYAALCRWTWRAMVERRLDADLRGWHRLLLDAAAKIGALPVEADHDRAGIAPGESAQRIRALADLVRLSIDAARVSDGAGFTGRAHVIEILRLLMRLGAFVPRDTIRAKLGLGNANLSRVLTLLALNGLAERETRGRRAAYRVTARGIRALEQADARPGRLEVPSPLLSPPRPSAPPRMVGPSADHKGGKHIVIFEPGAIIGGYTHNMPGFEDNVIVWASLRGMEDPSPTPDPVFPGVDRYYVPSESRH